MQIKSKFVAGANVEMASIKRGVGAGVSRSVALVGILATVAIGITCGLLVGSAARPAAVSPARTSVAFPLAPQQFRDPHDVDIEAVMQQPRRLRVNGGGLVTNFECLPESRITSGSKPIELSGHGVLALATKHPLWRDIRPGDRGSDVAELQLELRRLGFASSTSGSYDGPTRSAMASLLKSVGVAPPSSTLPLSYVLWLPAESVAVASCDVSPDTFVSDHEAVATLPAEVSSVRIKVWPNDLVAGPRQISVGGVTVPIADGVIVDPTALQTVYAAMVKVGAPEASGNISASASLALVEALEVASVPAGAVFDVAGQDGCIALEGGSAIRVNIVSSRLGQAIIEWSPDFPPSASVMLPPPSSATCA